MQEIERFVRTGKHLGNSYKYPDEDIAGPSKSFNTNCGSSLIRSLLDPAAFPHSVESIEMIETHISWVILTGPFAYKIKKPIKLRFLDFRDRISARAGSGHEPSEADLAVLEFQLKNTESLTPEEQRETVSWDSCAKIDAEDLSGRLRHSVSRSTASPWL